MATLQVVLLGENEPAFLREVVVAFLQAGRRDTVFRWAIVLLHDGAKVSLLDPSVALRPAVHSFGVARSDSALDLTPAPLEVTVRST